MNRGARVINLRQIYVRGTLRLRLRDSKAVISRDKNARIFHLQLGLAVEAAAALTPSG
jgi:hypothetical protein